MCILRFCYISKTLWLCEVLNFPHWRHKLLNEFSFSNIFLAINNQLLPSSKRQSHARCKKYTHSLTKIKLNKSAFSTEKSAKNVHNSIQYILHGIEHWINVQLSLKEGKDLYITATSFLFLHVPRLLACTTLTFSPFTITQFKICYMYSGLAIF